MKSYAILLAAGTGSRTGFSVPKQLAKIKNKEIILHSLEIFTKSSINFNAVIIATPPPAVFGFNWSDFFKKNTADGDIKKLHIITGGKTRQESVGNGVKYLESILTPEEKENAALFIHDSARPFVRDKELRLLLNKTAGYGAAFLCSMVTETVKEINPGVEKRGDGGGGGEETRAANYNRNEKVSRASLKLKTLARDNLISAKTPQVFKFNIIKRALDEAAKTNFISTDDISLVENLGLRAVPVLSTDFNIKITSALDVEIAELLYDKFK